MKAMIFSDLITSKNSILTLLGVTVLIAIFIAIPTGTLYGSIGACAAMIPFMYLFSISAYDEMNGWERFRLTLPISRRQVAYGRYASMLIVCACSLVIAIVLGLLIGLVVDALPEGIVPEGLRLSNAGVGEVIGAALLTQVVILARRDADVALHLALRNDEGDAHRTDGADLRDLGVSRPSWQYADCR